MAICSAYQNKQNGINVRVGCMVTKCSARLNTLSGITCSGSDTRLDGNVRTDNDWGIKVTASGNFIVRNVCRANTTNWNIAANNKCLVVNGTNAGAINGDSGGVSPGSVDPNANYTY